MHAESYVNAQPRWKDCRIWRSSCWARPPLDTPPAAQLHQAVAATALLPLACPPMQISSGPGGEPCLLHSYEIDAVWLSAPILLGLLCFYELALPCSRQRSAKFRRGYVSNVHLEGSLLSHFGARLDACTLHIDCLVCLCSLV